MSIIQWMGKYGMIYSYGDAPQQKKEKWSTDVCCDVDGCLKHMLISKRGQTQKDQILHDWIYMKCPEQACW